MIGRLKDCPDVERVFVMDYLHLYNPENDQACIMVFNVLDAYLDDKSAPVVLSASKLFYAFALKLKTSSSGILKDFILKISPQITRFLKGHTNHEFQFSVMHFLTELSDEAFVELIPITNHFHFKLKEHTDCKRLKCQLLFRFCELSLKTNSQMSKNDGIIDYLLSQLPYQPSIRMELVSYICQISSLCKELSCNNTVEDRYDVLKCL